MRVVASVLLLLVATACAVPQAVVPAAVAPAAVDPAPDALTPDLFPFVASSATFVDAAGARPRALRVEPAADAVSARLVMDVAGGAARALTVVRRGDSLYFAAGDSLGTELLRGGARPGDAWQTDGRRVRFETWERVTTPAGAWDAARVSARTGPAQLEHVETWWFARGVGLVRLRSEHGPLFADEMTRSSP
jgi:hypothetical protein